MEIALAASGNTVNQASNTMTCQEDVDVNELFSLSQKEDWDILLSRIHELKSPKVVLVSSRSDIRTDEQGTLLHIVCSSPNVHADIVQTLLQVAGPDLACIQDGLGHTALHDAVRSGAPMEVVDLLVTHQSVKVKDNLSLTPLDHVCERIIMREERHRYYDKQHKENNHTDSYLLWECAQRMLQALGQRDEEQQCMMMMHACIQASSSCPLALRQRVMNRYAHQLEMPDGFGNLPLHIAARNVVDEDEDVEVIQQVLDAYPAAIRVANENGSLPLDEAIRAGRTWSNGARVLFEAFPEAVLVSSQNRIPPAHYALVFEEIGRNGSMDSLYRMLKAQPELFRRPVPE